MLLKQFQVNRYYVVIHQKFEIHKLIIGLKIEIIVVEDAIIKNELVKYRFLRRDITLQMHRQLVC
ncbi:unnamed protein product (macronuclear) [Paramecium tetraurelia]|uniref:Uncharacterized protein n=1 Tax=Paramecium tetraurelia TaxID=5888 RepID=A0DLM0_PARTE|nr:uncharacterized protein GSPATT00039569001 [Paramecium tetraurelia]CAK83937.1 unnamed protein product [Paramecium tetraurelia]|eukprot:XP_001451334.1 hypothetical protein (macronuclear) [Paramecium tetraurelia strain d4-2]